MARSDGRMKGEVILRFEGGSALHGIKIEGTDDIDLYGVYVEPLAVLLTPQKDPHFVDIAGSETGQRNQPGDVDYIFYSLRRFTELLVKGNPTIFQFLWCEATLEEEAPAWHIMRQARRAAIHQGLAKSYLGYARAQLERLQGIRGQKRVKRPEYEAAHGYDTKYAAHVLRLVHEGKEALTQQHLTLPLTGEVLRECLAVRKGEIPWPETETLLAARIAELARIPIDAFPTSLEASASLYRACELAHRKALGL